MKISHTFRPTAAQRYQDKQRAARALGRPLREPECVHHFTATQLVICPDTAYHTLLHTLAYDYKREHDPAFDAAERAKVEAIVAQSGARAELLGRLVMHVNRWTPERLEAELAELSKVLPY
jgi:hypothetical protein